MNVAEVIAWKFDDQPGMCCRAGKNGVLKLVKFPGGIPTKATQAKWIAEYQAHLDGGGKRKFSEK